MARAAAGDYAVRLTLPLTLTRHRQPNPNPNPDPNPNPNPNPNPSPSPNPNQETVQRPLDSKPHTRVPADADGLKDELCRLKAAMRVELGRTVPGTTILRSMADAAFSLAEDIRKARRSATKAQALASPSP